MPPGAVALLARSVHVRDLSAVVIDHDKRQAGSTQHAFYRREGRVARLAAFQAANGRLRQAGPLGKLALIEAAMLTRGSEQFW